MARRSPARGGAFGGVASGVAVVGERRFGGGVRCGARWGVGGDGVGVCGVGRARVAGGGVDPRGRLQREVAGSVADVCVRGVSGAAGVVRGGNDGRAGVFAGAVAVAVSADAAVVARVRS